MASKIKGKLQKVGKSGADLKKSALKSRKKWGGFLKMIKNNFEKIEKSETVFKNSQKFGKSGAILKLNIKK